IYQNIVIVIGDNNNPVHQNTFYNTIYQNHEDVYQHVSGNNSDHQNMVHNNPIRQNIGEIYQDVGNNNSVHQNMIHNTIYQTPENTYQNVDDNDSLVSSRISVIVIIGDDRILMTIGIIILVNEINVEGAFMSSLYSIS
ncbi:16585_t:CDS:2, partial [Entrophospora sp. SA101]